MIANITAGCKANSMILYNEKKVSMGKAYIIDSSSEMMKSSTFAIDVLNAASLETKTNNANIQISLSLAIGEDISDEKFSLIAKDYLQKIGFENSPFVIYRHKDTAHEHIHICTSIIGNDSKKVNMYYNFIKSQKATRELEVKFNLKLVSSLKNPKNVDKEINYLSEYKSLLSTFQEQDFSKSNIRKVIAKASTIVLNQYKATSFVELKKLYGNMGIEIESKNNGYIFKLMAKPNSPIIYGSDLYMLFNNDVLNKYYDKNIKVKSKFLPNRVERSLNQLFKAYETINVNDFTEQLSLRNIVPIFDKYADGRIYGLSFLDEKSGYIYKASDVNKKYSYAKLKDILSENIETKFSIEHFLDDTFYTLYNRNKTFAIYDKLLDFAKKENTISDLKIALYEFDNSLTNIDNVVNDYINNKISKILNSQDVIEEKGNIIKALNEYYENSITLFKANKSEYNIIDFIQSQLSLEKHEMVDYIKDQCSVKFFQANKLSSIVDDFIDNKQQLAHLQPLNDFVKDFVKDEFSLLLGDIKGVEKLHFLNQIDTKQLFNSFMLKLQNSQNPILANFEVATINDIVQKAVSGVLVKEIANSKYSIIESLTEASFTLSKDVSKIDLFSYLLLDKNNFKNHVQNLLDQKNIQFSEQNKYIDKYITKVEEVKLPLLKLNQDITLVVEQNNFYTNYFKQTDQTLPTINKLYFNSTLVDDIKIKHKPILDILFKNDKEKIDNFFKDKISIKIVNDDLLLYKKEFFDHLESKFNERADLHLTGHKKLDYYRYILNNEDFYKQDLKKYISNRHAFYSTKYTLDQFNAIVDSSKIIDKSIDYIRNEAAPMLCANIITKNTLKAYIATLKNSNSNYMISEKLLNPTVILQLKEAVKKQILHANNEAVLVLQNPKFNDKLNKVIVDYIDQQQKYYYQLSINNVVNNIEQGSVLLTKLFGHQAKEGLNSAKNDKKKKKNNEL